MGHFIEHDRSAPMLLAPDMQDWIADGHLARFVVGVIDRMDLQTLERSYRGRGERAYHPRMLLALLVYGYATGVFSSRKIERACIDSIAFRYIAANTSPDHDTIADFRKRVLPELPKVFLHVLSVAHELGFLKLGQVSLDGTKVKANASKHHALSYAHAGKIKAKLKREITKLLKLAQVVENERDPELDVPAEIARREVLIAKIDEARATIEERERARHQEIRVKHAAHLAQRKEQQKQTGQKIRGRRPRLPKLTIEPTAQINLTDEESRVMPTADGFIQGFNAQATVSMSRFIVANNVTQATNDKEQLVPALEALKALPPSLGAVNAIAADAGYFSASNVAACEAAEIVPHLAIGREPHNSWLANKLRKPLSEPAADASGVERMRHRLQADEGRKFYAMRKITVEPVFGIIKSAMGFRTFSLRGIENVEGEWQLVCAAANLKHLHRINSGQIKWNLAG